MLILLHVQMLCRHFIDHDLYYSVFAKLDNTYSSYNVSFEYSSFDACGHPKRDVHTAKKSVERFLSRYM